MPREPKSFEADVAASVETWIHKYMPAVAERLGPLPGVIPTKPELQERWDLRTDKVPPEMTDALADEALKMVLDEYTGKGEPLPDADALTKLVAAKANAVLYPYRSEVYGRGHPRPEARVKVAREYARRSMKQAEQVTSPETVTSSGTSPDVMVPEPTAPAPTDEPPPAVRALSGGY